VSLFNLSSRRDLATLQRLVLAMDAFLAELELALATREGADESADGEEDRGARRRRRRRGERSLLDDLGERTRELHPRVPARAGTAASEITRREPPRR
jgi:hypothetical protein